jgi:putative flippase GtrA
MGMITFTKAQIASLLATGIDFLVSMLLYRLISPHSPVENAHAEGNKMIAGAIGTITGGICHFLISRNWVFQAREKDSLTLISSYLIVWVGNLILNLSVLFLLTKYANMNLLAAKIVVAVSIAVFYNYVLQKKFVFK